jgi:hypothetical protein
MIDAIARALTWLIRFVDRAYGLPACRECGCTEHAACNDGCGWIEPELCSTCADPHTVLLHDMRAEGYLV